MTYGGSVDGHSTGFGGRVRLLALRWVRREFGIFKNEGHTQRAAEGSRNEEFGAARKTWWWSLTGMRGDVPCVYDGCWM